MRKILWIYRNKNLSWLCIFFQNTRFYNKKVTFLEQDNKQMVTKSFSLKTFDNSEFLINSLVLVVIEQVISNYLYSSSQAVHGEWEE